MKVGDKIGRARIVSFAEEPNSGLVTIEEDIHGGVATFVVPMWLLLLEQAQAESPTKTTMREGEEIAAEFYGSPPHRPPGPVSDEELAQYARWGDKFMERLVAEVVRLRARVKRRLSECPDAVKAAAMEFPGTVRDDEALACAEAGLRAAEDVWLGEGELVCLACQRRTVAVTAVGHLCPACAEDVALKKGEVR